MAALEELDVSSIQGTGNEALIKEFISKLFWAWFFSNQDRKITTIHWWIFNKTLYVRDIEGVFILLFGNPNGATA